MAKALKYILYILSIGLLWLPLIQDRFHIADEYALEGAVSSPVPITLNTQTWFDGSFQEKFTRNTEYYIGFHATGVRLYDQLNYWTGHEYSDIVAGKGDFLLSSSQTRSYLGEDLIGEDSVEHVCVRMRQLQQMLNDSGKFFFVILAPNKSRVYPERIPAYFRTADKKAGNYEYFRDAFRKYGIPCFDAERWIETVKDTAPYPVYTSRGIHWSRYAYEKAGDTLMGFMQALMHQKMNRVKFNGIALTDLPEASENDLEKVLNLTFDLPPEKQFAQWNIDLTPDPALKKPRVLIIGDSYYWNISNMGIPNVFFADSSAFIYYNATVFSRQAPIPSDEINEFRAAMSADVVFFIYTEGNLKEIGNNFTETVLRQAGEAKGR